MLAATSEDDKNYIKSIVAPDNILVLKDPAMFGNTVRVQGSCEIPSVNPGENGCFSGYVFRGDHRSPEIIFREGFKKQVVLTQEDIGVVTGDMNGLTRNCGISTTVCAIVASRYGVGTTRVPGFPFNPLNPSGFPKRSNVYLIDAVSFTGFAIPSPRPDHYLVGHFPILRRIYEVNFTHNIPSDHIVGLVWPFDEKPFCNAQCPWVFPDMLCLAVNPEYRGGMDGAKEVVARFNNEMSDSRCSIQ